MKLETAWLVLINLGLVAVFWVLIYLGLREWQAWRISRRLLKKGRPNAGLRPAREGQGFNPANIYFTMNYDCRRVDIRICGVLPQCRFWSITAYDRYTVPLESFLVDETLVTADDNHYTAWLSRRPRGRPNEIDVSASPRGLLIVRNSFPGKPDEVLQNIPQVEVLPAGVQGL